VKKTTQTPSLISNYISDTVTAALHKNTQEVLEVKALLQQLKQWLVSSKLNHLLVKKTILKSLVNPRTIPLLGGCIKQLWTWDQLLCAFA
jgi:predicted transcriptional regulator